MVGIAGGRERIGWWFGRIGLEDEGLDEVGQGLCCFGLVGRAAIGAVRPVSVRDTAPPCPYQCSRRADCRTARN